MPDKTYVLEIERLNRRQRLNLLDYVTADLVKFDQPEDRAGEFGEPVTATAIVALTTLSLAGIFAWLAKDRQTHFKGKLRTLGLDVSVEFDLKPGRTDEEPLRIGLKNQGIALPDNLKNRS